jgi:eukaryotic translation initiation factor 2C
VKFTKPAPIGNWVCINFFSLAGGTTGTNENPHILVQALRGFHEGLNNVGMQTSAPPPNRYNQRGVNYLNINTIESAVEAAFKDLRSGPKPEFVLCVLPDQNSSLYSAIKKAGDVMFGVTTICVIHQKFTKERGQVQYFANVALKLNLKKGGINHSLDRSKLGIVAEGKTMVVGLDVTHPAPKSNEAAKSNDKSPSIAGIVASIDSTLGQWPAELRIQEGRKEMITDIKELFKGRLRLWREKQRALPHNIIIYRDGVSEGQYKMVLEEELPLMKDCIKEVYPADLQQQNLPRLSIIVVGKRHHTRFFATHPDNADGTSNCKNGTIVDRGVTEVRDWDFFLQAHSGLQGTARPAHYYVVHDEIFANGKPEAKGNAADALEQLTHNMCYLFGRATKAVSVCPPAYYADLVCDRSRCYLHKAFNASASTTPATSVIKGSEPEYKVEFGPGDVKIHQHLKDTMFYI